MNKERILYLFSVFLTGSLIATDLKNEDFSDESSVLEKNMDDSFLTEELDHGQADEFFMNNSQDDLDDPSSGVAAMPEAEVMGLEEESVPMDEQVEESDKSIEPEQVSFNDVAAEEIPVAEELPVDDDFGAEEYMSMDDMFAADDYLSLDGGDDKVDEQHGSEMEASNDDFAVNTDS